MSIFGDSLREDLSDQSGHLSGFSDPEKTLLALPNIPTPSDKQSDVLEFIPKAMVTPATYVLASATVEPLLGEIGDFEFRLRFYAKLAAILSRVPTFFDSKNDVFQAMYTLASSFSESFCCGFTPYKVEQQEARLFATSSIMVNSAIDDVAWNRARQQALCIPDTPNSIVGGVLSTRYNVPYYDMNFLGGNMSVWNLTYDTVPPELQGNISKMKDLFDVDGILLVTFYGPTGIPTDIGQFFKDKKGDKRSIFLPFHAELAVAGYTAILPTFNRLRSLTSSDRELVRIQEAIRYFDVREKKGLKEGVDAFVVGDFSRLV